MVWRALLRIRPAARLFVGPRRLRGPALILASVLPFSPFSPGLAQITLPPLHVDGEAASACVDVQVESARSLSFDCLNRQLKADAQSQGGSAPAVTARDVAATGAPTAVATFSYTATSIRMGDAFGKSATPQRPPAPSFTNALVPHSAGAR